MYGKRLITTLYLCSPQLCKNKSKNVLNAHFWHVEMGNIMWRGGDTAVYIHTILMPYVMLNYYWFIYLHQTYAQLCIIMQVRCHHYRLTNSDMIWHILGVPLGQGKYLAPTCITELKLPFCSSSSVLSGYSK